MKYERTEHFKRDYRRLSRSEQAEFRRCISERFVPAIEGYLDNPSRTWPRGLRVKDVKGAKGILEMTWSFTDPDGRATWEWIEIDGDPAVRWRRVGGHSVFKEP